MVVTGGGGGAAAFDGGGAGGGSAGPGTLVDGTVDSTIVLTSVAGPVADVVNAAASGEPVWLGSVGWARSAVAMPTLNRPATIAPSMAPMAIRRG